MLADSAECWCEEFGTAAATKNKITLMSGRGAAPPRKHCQTRQEHGDCTLGGEDCTCDVDGIGGTTVISSAWICGKGQIPIMHD